MIRERVNNNHVLDFQKEIIEYCRSDVDLLRRSMQKLREDFKKLENIDPLKYVTIASVCMSIYRTNYMSKTEELLLFLNMQNQIILVKCLSFGSIT